MVLYDPNSTIGLIFSQSITGVTGSLFLSLLLFVGFLLALCLAFRLPMELSAVFIFPFLLVALVATGQLLQVLGVFIVYFAVLIARNYFLN